MRAGRQPSHADSSLSTAPLPPRYAVSLAASGVPNDASLHAAYIAGAEAVSDVAGREETLIPIPRRGVLSTGNVGHPQDSHSHSQRGAWRTAGYLRPCSCSLASYEYAYANLASPPTAPALPHLSAISNVPVGDMLRDWSTGDELDIDPSLEKLEEFAPEWPTAWRVANAKRKGKGKERYDVRDVDMEVDVRVTVAKHIGHIAIPTVPTRVQQTEANRSSSHRSSSLAAPEPVVPPLDYLADAASRRAWWRERISADPAYGCYFPLFPRTTWPAPALAPGVRLPRAPRVAPDAFRPPRNLHTLAHPLHPDVTHYCAHVHASTRVYWLVPVHGPVVVPTLEDPVVREEARPWASRGVFVDGEGGSDEPAGGGAVTTGGADGRRQGGDAHQAYSVHTVGPQFTKPANPPRPVPIHWTPALLRAFIAHFEVLQQDPVRPYGALHLALSGPKPDPFLALPPPKPLAAHICIPNAEADTVKSFDAVNDALNTDAANATRTTRTHPNHTIKPTTLLDKPPPVRPECGDHVRIYVDARRALSLRTWLHWWEVDAGVASGHGISASSRAGAVIVSDGAAAPDASPKVRPFARARFALVGTRGEVLVVA